MATNTLNISNAAQSNLAISDFTVNSMNTDGPTGEEETEYQNTRWANQFGYFNNIADLKSAILDKAIWCVGKGYTAEAEAEVILDHISGNGKDTFDSILFNMVVTMCIGGDSFSEIIKDKETGTILNLKPLDPSTMKIIVDSRGMIIRYEQMNKTQSSKTIKFKPEEIFHLCNNRIADQIHGISDVDAIEQTLLAEGESFEDMKKIMHRQAKPLIMFKLGTDDASKIANFITKMDKATRDGENIYIPDDANAVSYEVVQVNPSPIVLDWRNEIRKKFYRTIGLPELFQSGGGDSTESGGKIGYLTYEQKTEYVHRFLELQIWAQLQLKINLIPPATLSAQLQEDEAKDPNNFQPNDMMAGSGQ